jgi:hypothetical protein
VCNGLAYHPDAHRWAIEKNLTIVGDSDIHDPSPYLQRTPENHRTLTLVFAKDRSIESVGEALAAGRTAVWFGEQIIGREALLSALFAGCVQVKPGQHRLGNAVWCEVENRCELDIELERVGTVGPAKITLPACSTWLLKLQSPDRAESVDLAYRAVNFLVGPDQLLEVKLTIAIPSAAPASSIAPAAH